MAHIDRVLRSNIKLRHLQLIAALDEFRHIGRTAEFLSVTQPAVSKMLGEVEQMLGVVLFERSSRGTEPTTSGQALIRFARSVLAGYERARDEIANVESGALGRTRVGSMVVALPTVIAPAVEALKARAPTATVLIEEGDLAHLLPKLRVSEVDFIVGRLEPGYSAPDLVTERLYDERMVAVAAPTHPLARKRTVRWRDIAAFPCVLPPPWASLRVKLEQEFYREGVNPPSDLVESASFLAQSTFLRSRNAISFMAQSVARQYTQDGVVATLPVTVPVEVPPVGMIFMRERTETAVTRALVECVRLVAKARGATKARAPDSPALPSPAKAASRGRR